ncbi:zinc finger protein [Colletotrichum graminicola]|uniref:Zinc finger protein n=1 Tax=Colletotrichum graminicola (strain M1.001 / M2 / FGSC 10212) TaxID=645133 RepID=E3Q2Y3_COLGM|nr:zinc finger protein [Colletotrichum graminicola M1.001]EFQ24962.1 zinc finger protein [Colletotrichum graminicola M1.001]WDK15485.1 zinc finger protein [Colletotrichum graminicola]
MKRSREAEEEQPFSGYPADEYSSPGTPEADDRLAKFTELDPSAETALEDFAMKCSMPPHREALTFQSYDEYEAHYVKTHTNRCLECGRNLPSEHLLSVHHEECHDSFAAVRRERGEHTYSCFVEGCERKCMTPQKRRMHLIDKHGFPKNYFFAVTKEGIDGRRSLLVEGGHHRRKSSSAFGTTKESKRRSGILESSAPQTKESQAPGKISTEPTPTDSVTTERTDTEMDDLAGAMSALQFVPNSVRFGRGGGRAGFAKR